MNVRGFTFEDYARLLKQGLKSGYTFVPLVEFLEDDTLSKPYAIIRHDVDRKADTARTMARLEAELGVKTTYYFRRKTFDPELAKLVDELGHEVGYHYEDYAAADGDLALAHETFARTLDRFRASTPIRTICAHGSPLSQHHNLDMWKHPESPSLESYDLLGEAYLTPDIGSGNPDTLTYFSDTGRQWGTTLPDTGTIERTSQLQEVFTQCACPNMYLLVHPGRWSRSSLELVERVTWDLAAEAGKRVVRTMRRASSVS